MGWVRFSKIADFHETANDCRDLSSRGKMYKPEGEVLGFIKRAEEINKKQQKNIRAMLDATEVLDVKAEDSHAQIMGVNILGVGAELLVLQIIVNLRGGFLLIALLGLRTLLENLINLHYIFWHPEHKGDKKWALEQCKDFEARSYDPKSRKNKLGKKSLAERAKETKWLELYEIVYSDLSNYSHFLFNILDHATPKYFEAKTLECLVYTMMMYQDSIMALASFTNCKGVEYLGEEVKKLQKDVGIYIKRLKTPEKLKCKNDKPVEDSHNCPLSTVHRRIDEVHALWHEALENYYHPDRFRLHLNNCIQTLRNVTFHLQNQKDCVPDFDSWYAKWQAHMRQDKIMKWLVEARNLIVKAGDLETKSLCRVSILSSYEQPPYKEFEEKPLTRPEEITRKIALSQLPPDILEDGILRVERRWIVKELPGTELLEALAYGYGFLSSLLNDCHKQIGRPQTYVAVQKGNEKATKYKLPTEHLKGQLPCMAATQEKRTALFRIKTNEPILLSATDFPKEEKISKGTLEKRYGKIGKLTSNTLKTEAKLLMKRAQQILKADGHHITLAVFKLSNGERQIASMFPEDRAEKYLMWHALASHVEKIDAVAIWVISEAWVAPFDSKNPGRYPVDSPDRKEALIIHAAEKKGTLLNFSSVFERSKKGIKFGPTREVAQKSYGFLTPIFRVWGKA